MSINSRTKGVNAELEFSHLVYGWTGISLIRNLEQPRGGGCDLCVHVADSHALADSFRRLSIECKRHCKINPGLLKKWWSQAQAQANGRIPVLAYRADRRPWQVAIPITLINSTLSTDPSFENTVTVALPTFCMIVRERDNDSL